MAEKHLKWEALYLELAPSVGLVEPDTVMLTFWDGYKALFIISEDVAWEDKWVKFEFIVL